MKYLLILLAALLCACAHEDPNPNKYPVTYIFVPGYNGSVNMIPIYAPPTTSTTKKGD